MVMHHTTCFQKINTKTNNDIDSFLIPTPRFQKCSLRQDSLSPIHLTFLPKLQTRFPFTHDKIPFHPNYRINDHFLLRIISVSPINHNSPPFPYQPPFPIFLNYFLPSDQHPPGFLPTESSRFSPQ